MTYEHDEFHELSERPTWVYTHPLPAAPAMAEPFAVQDGKALEELQGLLSRASVIAQKDLAPAVQAKGPGPRLLAGLWLVAVVNTATALATYSLSHLLTAAITVLLALAATPGVGPNEDD